MKLTKTENKWTLEHLKINAKSSAKKTIVLALTGAFVLTGIAALQLPQSVAQAATSAFHYRGDHRGSYRNNGTDPQSFDANAAAQDLADTFGLDKQMILDYNAQGWKFRDLDRASFIAYTAQKPLADVLSAKTVTNSWRDVGASFGLTREQIKSAHQALISKNLAADVQLDEAAVKKLLSDGYRPHDIVMASALSKKSATSIQNLLTMKKINNTWYDVAASLGLSDQEFQDCRDDIADHFHGRRSGDAFDRGHGGYCGNGGGWHNSPRQ